MDEKAEFVQAILNMFLVLLFCLCSDGITGTSLGARMLQGGVKKGLLLRNMQVE